MKRIYISFLLFTALGCQQKLEDKRKPETVDKNFEMYQMSEMSLLMEQMYVDNERLKQRILKGETIGKFPNHFLKIHKAVMTKDKEKDAFFTNQASLFIASQELIYKDPKNSKDHFNASVTACISCHEVKCGGPISRIKKLYIH